MCQVLPCRDDTVLKHLVNMFHFLTWSAVIFVCQTHLPLGYLLGYASIDNKTKRGYTAPFPNYRYSSFSRCPSIMSLSLCQCVTTLFTFFERFFCCPSSYHHSTCSWPVSRFIRAIFLFLVIAVTYQNHVVCPQGNFTVPKSIMQHDVICNPYNYILIIFNMISQ